MLHDAELRTESWRRRHSPEAIAQLGVWRWRGMQDNAAMILGLIVGKRVLDFGGADAPLWFGSVIDDIRCKRCSPSDDPWEVIFTSHTLEHCESVRGTLERLRNRLEDGGTLIVHVPAYTCQRWNADAYDNPAQPTGHKWTFGLGEATAIDRLVQEAGFDVQFAEYVGDDSILLVGRKV